MSDLLLPLSESEEMYLVNLARLKEAGEAAPVPLSHLAERMQVQPVSAHQMVRKLEECGLLAYIPYKGVDLTANGQRRALQILRRRRLWQVFLFEKLNYPAQQADELACRLEHAIPPEAAERLADYLGHPVNDPQGQPIPNADLAELPPGVPLDHLAVGESGLVLEISAGAAARAFLVSQGVQTGEKLTLLALGGSGDILALSAAGHSIHLAAVLAQAIRVQPG